MAGFFISIEKTVKPIDWSMQDRRISLLKRNRNHKITDTAYLSKIMK